MGVCEPGASLAADLDIHWVIHRLNMKSNEVEEAGVVRGFCASPWHLQQ